jgi:hypothetical protein
MSNQLVKAFLEVEQAPPRHFCLHRYLSFHGSPQVWACTSSGPLTLHRSRPGILVLINDADWELEGEASYALQPNDNILFVSTLHGG